MNPLSVEASTEKMTRSVEPNSVIPVIAIENSGIVTIVILNTVSDLDLVSPVVPRASSSGPPRAPAASA